MTRMMNVKGASMNDTHLTGITCMEGEDKKMMLYKRNRFMRKKVTQLKTTYEGWLEEER